EIRFASTNFYIARFHSKSHCKFREGKPLRNPFWANQTGSGMFHQIVKELVLPGLQEGVQTNANYIDALA
ncbi:MAG: hypothetical protein WA766_01920, partial [Candidatus Acidiferrales bacterium]